MSNQPNVKADSNPPIPVLEMVLFHLQPDVSQETVLLFSDQMQKWLEQQPGYLHRELFMGEGGQWLDIVRWATMVEAMAASEQFFAQPFAAKVGDIFAPGASSQHLYQLRNYVAVPA